MFTERTRMGVVVQTFKLPRPDVAATKLKRARLIASQMAHGPDCDRQMCECGLTDLRIALREASDA